MADLEASFEQARELHELTRANEGLRRQKFLGELAEFRGDVFRKVAQLGALGTEGPVVVFEVDPPEDDATLYKDPLQVALMLLPADTYTRRIAPPTIRLITNERVRTPDGMECITQDFSTNRYNAAQYFMNLYNLLDDPDAKATQAPVIRIASRYQVAFENILAFTNSVAAVPFHHATDRFTFPFGYPGSLEDEVYALEKAQEIFGDIENLEPLAVTALQL